MIARAAAIASIAWASVGCGFYCMEDECAPVMQSGKEIRGRLVGVDSSKRTTPMGKHARARSEYGDDARSAVAEDETFALDETQVEVELGRVSLRFRRPAAAASNTLASLDAELCEWTDDGPTCRPVDGEIDVVEDVASCGEGACGALDVTIAIPEPSPLPDGPVVYGRARLRYREWREEKCTKKRVGSDSELAWRL